MTPEERVSKIAEAWWTAIPSSKPNLEDLIAQAIRDAMADEREACAKLVEAYARSGNERDFCLIMGDVIRNARGEVKR